MKRILFLLLLTVSVYGQNPSRFAKIQITGNSNSGTATKVNVQEANGEVNTQTINTGFNKNIGLGGSDVVGANTLLNQYSTTPVDWTATAFNSGQVVFYGGKQWIAKIATVAGDVPAVSSKWEEITFEALANKTTTVDQTIIDGSTNAVSSNAVFDGLALKSNIGHTHVASQITDLSKASVGLGNVDNTSDLSKPLSTATQTALNGKENSFTKNTAFNKNFGTTAGTVVEGNYPPAKDGTGASGTWGINITGSANYSILWSGLGADFSTYGSDLFQGIGYDGTEGKVKPYRPSEWSSWLGLGTNAYSSTAYLPLSGGTVSGTISASPATTANQVPTWGQVQAAARPYKVYTAVLTQQNTEAPSAVVLENTLGGTVVWTRNATGNYYGTLNSAFPDYNKIALFQGGTMWGTLPLEIIRVQYLNSNTIQIITQQATDGALVDSSLNGTTIEIRVYL